MQGTRFGGLGIGFDNARVRAAIRRIEQLQFTGGNDLGVGALRTQVEDADAAFQTAIDNIRNFSDGGSQLQISVQSLIDYQISLQSTLDDLQQTVTDVNTLAEALGETSQMNSDDIIALQSAVTTITTSQTDINTAIDAINNVSNSGTTLYTMLTDLTTNSLTTDEKAYVTAMKTTKFIIDTPTTLVEIGESLVFKQGDVGVGYLVVDDENKAVFGGADLQMRTQNFYNRAYNLMYSTELVTWDTLRFLANIMWPIGSLRLMSVARDDAFIDEIFMVWKLHAAADGKYLKMTTDISLVGTLQSASVIAHSHGVGSLATALGGGHTHANSLAVASDGAHTHPITALVSTSTGDHAHGLSTVITNTTTQHSHTGTTTVGDGGHRHYPSTGTYNGTALNGSDAAGSVNGSVAADVGFFTVAVGQTGDGRHTHTFTTDPVVGHSHTMIGNTDTTGAHTHSTTGTSDSAGAHTHALTGAITAAANHTHVLSGSTDVNGSTNEVASLYLLIYRRVA